MYGELPSTVRTTHHDTGHTAHRRRPRRLRGRVTAAAAATLIAVGGGAAAAPSAAAQDLPGSVQGSYESLPPEAQQVVGSVVGVGAAAILLPYYFIWCPIGIAAGSIDATTGVCTF
jgi:hypothetical protein